MSLYLAVLFVALTPGVLLSLPPKASKMTVVLTHAVVFTVIWHFTHRAVYSMTSEGFQNNMNAQMNSNANPNMNANANSNAMEGFKRKD